MKAIGIDLGGSHVTAAVVGENGAIEDRAEIAVDDRSFAAVARTVVQAVAEIRGRIKGGAIEAIGIGSPGNVDFTTGAIRYSPNFGWRDAPLGATLGAEIGMPVHVANDARCAALGEYTYGTGVGTRDFALLTLGTGIGGGFVANGGLLLGRDGGAGELGHHQIRRDGFVCGCGKIGCFEAQASGTGLMRHALAVAPSFPRSELMRKPPEKIGSKAIRKAAELGDPHGLAAWGNFVDDLACGLANLIAFVNPQTIALGGGVSSAGEFLLAALRPKVDALTTMVPAGRTQIVVAKLGNDAGAIGAAAMARRGGLEAASRALDLRP